MALGAVFSTLWLSNRNSEYVENCRLGAANPPECAAVATERDAARGTQITTAVAAGALTVAAGVALGIWLLRPPQSATTQRVQLILTPGVTESSAALRWRF
jgi:hypothetical protein